MLFLRFGLMKDVSDSILHDFSEAFMLTLVPKNGPVLVVRSHENHNSDRGIQVRTDATAAQWPEIREKSLPNKEQLE